MALKLQKEDKSGSLYEYHRILSMTFSEDKVRIFVQSYKDQAARQAKKRPVATWYLEIPKSELDISTPERPQAYEKLKDSALQGAQDC